MGGAGADIGRCATWDYAECLIRIALVFHPAVIYTLLPLVLCYDCLADDAFNLRHEEFSRFASSH